MTDVMSGGGRAAAGLPVRPQPVGVFPLPAGLLLVPGGVDTEPARLALLAGRLPRHWPASMRAHQLAMAGELDSALTVLCGDHPVTRYNRFVIEPDAEDPQVLRDDLGPEYAVLVDLLCFMLGRRDVPPEFGTSDGELAALVRAAQASHAVGAGEPTMAAQLLADAANQALPVAPPLAAILMGAAATIRRDAEGASADVVTIVQGALHLLEGTDLRVRQAELHLTLALMLHDLAGENRDKLAVAIKHHLPRIRWMVPPLRWPPLVGSPSSAPHSASVRTPPPPTVPPTVPATPTPRPPLRHAYEPALANGTRPNRWQS